MRIFLLIMAFMALGGCAGKKSTSAEQRPSVDQECGSLFSRMNDYKNNPSFSDYEDRMTLLKGQYPVDLGNGNILRCKHSIRCGEDNYCVIIEADGNWGYVL